MLYNIELTEIRSLFMRLHFYEPLNIKIMKKHLSEMGVCYIIVIMLGLFASYAFYDACKIREVATKNVGEWNAAIERPNNLGLICFRGELYTLERAKKERDAWKKRLQ